MTNSLRKSRIVLEPFTKNVRDVYERSEVLVGNTVCECQEFSVKITSLLRSNHELSELTTLGTRI
jgi:hypothetical protein